jgi:hypothetical protein
MMKGRALRFMARLTVRGIRRAFVVITNLSLERHCPLDARAHGLQSGAAVQVVKVGNPLRAALAKIGHGEEAERLANSEILLPLADMVSDRTQRRSTIRDSSS